MKRFTKIAISIVMRRTVPFAGQWRIWQRLVLSRLHGHLVLELGCGLGDLLADMIEAGYDCRAIEQSKEMVDATRSTLQKCTLIEPDWVIQGQAQCMPFIDASFDTVVSTFPSEYIYDDNTISEVKRVLRPGGRLIVIIGANLLPVGPLQLFLLLIQMLVYGPLVFFRTGKQGLRHNQMAIRQHSNNPEDRILHGNREISTDITTVVVPDAEFGKHIPLEEHGLRRHCELVCSRYWEVYIVSGEK